MKPLPSLRKTLPESGEDNEGHILCPDVSQLERLQISEPLRLAVRTYDAEKVAASDMGVERAYLSRMCVGAKPTNLTHLYRLIQANPVAGKVAASAIAGWARMTAVPFAVEVRLEPGQAQVLRHVRATLGPMWVAYRDKLAGQLFGCDGDLLEAAIELDARVGR